MNLYHLNIIQLELFYKNYNSAENVYLLITNIFNLLIEIKNILIPTVQALEYVDVKVIKIYPSDLYHVKVFDISGLLR
jgi:hypothetical protein